MPAVQLAGRAEWIIDGRTGAASWQRRMISEVETPFVYGTVMQRPCLMWWHEQHTDWIASTDQHAVRSMMDESCVTGDHIHRAWRLRGAANTEKCGIICVQIKPESRILRRCREPIPERLFGVVITCQNVIDRVPGDRDRKKQSARVSSNKQKG